MPDMYNVISSKVEAAVLASGQKKVYVDYSAYDSDDDDEPIDNLDEVAVKGKVVLVSAADSCWGGKKSKDYRSDVLESPTWLQACVYANAMIRSVRDTHHVFFEGLDKIGEEGDVTVYEFVMGS